MPFNVTPDEIEHIAERVAELRSPKGAQKVVTLLMPWALLATTAIALPWCVWVTVSLFKLDPAAARYTAKDALVQKMEIEGSLRMMMESKLMSLDTKLDRLQSQGESRTESMKIALDRINVTLAKKGIE